MANRPQDPFVAWSTDENYDPGPAGWNETPTRIRIASDARAQGFNPDASPPAQWFNEEIGRVQDMVVYLDNIDVKNWPITVDLPSGFMPASSPACEGEGGFIRIAGSITDGDDGLLSRLARSKDGGRTWTVISTGITDVGNGIRQFEFNADGNGLLFAYGAGVNDLVMAYYDAEDDDYSAEVGIPSDTIIRSGPHFSAGSIFPGGRWYATGKSAAGAGMVARISVSGGGVPAFSTATLTSAGTTPITLQAFSDDGDLAAFFTQTGHCWSGNPAVDPIPSRGNVASGAAMRGLAWWHDRFILVVYDGVNGYVYTSLDGISWSQVSSLGEGIDPTSIAVKGGVCVIECENDAGTRHLLFSVDQGVTWERASQGPIQERHGAATFLNELPRVHMSCFGLNGSQICLVVRDDEFSAKVSLSLRT